VQSPPRKGGLRLPFLDGLRGLASLYVLLFHASAPKIIGHGEPSWPMRILRGCLGHGHFGVVFFIVLSGFSLMLPIARSGSFELQGGFWQYLSRRARRILPPYYAALIFSIGLIVAYNKMAARGGIGPQVDSALTPGAIVSHLLLVHNLTFDWAFRINGPMWSVATEWQIYFLFPAILLPLCRTRGGIFLTVGVAWLLGSLPQIFLPGDQNFFWACPWFLGSFALGMMVAVIGFSPQYRDAPWRKRIPWGTMTLLLLGTLVLLMASGVGE
jgi:peptidoglycan/LPS O-acetylase OafA/YrhL